MQVEFNIRWGCVCRIKTVECGPAETAQTCGNQRRGGSLAEPNQKVAATKVHGAVGGQTPHLLWPTQNDVSRIPTCGLKLTPAHRSVKIGVLVHMIGDTFGNQALIANSPTKVSWPKYQHRGNDVRGAS